MAGPMKSSDDHEPISAINVTPFVDVVLVLLVIFMVTAPTLMKDAIGIELPKASSGDQKSTAPLSISIDKNGQAIVDGKSLDLDALKARVKEEVAKNPDTQAVISADTDCRHGDVVRVMDAVKSSGMQKFALQIQKE